MSKSPTHTALKVLGCLVAATALCAAFLAFAFVWPKSQEVDGVDAVVVLSGDFGDRLDKAEALMNEGAAPVLVHVGVSDYPEIDAICTEKQRFEVVCLRPRPDNTRTEAAAVGKLSAERQWDSVAVVTSAPHLWRASIAFRRCIDARVEMVRSNPDFELEFWIRQIAFESAGVARALLVDRGC